MKKLAIIVLCIVGLLTVLLFTLSVILRDSAFKLIERQTAKYLISQPDIERMQIDMFTHFPDVSVRITNAVVMGTGDFEGDTVAVVPTGTASFSIMALLGKKEVSIPQVRLSGARINFRVNEAGVDNIRPLFRRNAPLASLDSIPLCGLQLDLTGDLAFTDQILQLNLRTETAVGTIDTKAEIVPARGTDLTHIQCSINVADADIQRTWQMLPSFAVHCDGKWSASLLFDLDLDKEYLPVRRSINGEGTINTSEVTVRDNPTLLQLNPVIKKEKLSQLTVDSLSVHFTMRDGRVTVSPFTTRLSGNPVTMQGYQSVDGKMDYTASLTVNRNSFSQDVEELLRIIPGNKNIQDLTVDVRVTGTTDNPVVKTDMTKALEKVRKSAKKELKALKEKALEELHKLFR